MSYKLEYNTDALLHLKEYVLKDTNNVKINKIEYSKWYSKWSIISIKYYLKIIGKHNIYYLYPAISYPVKQNIQR